MNYDVIIVGAGPGGYVCGIRASQLGQKVAIVDREWLGGVCLNVGCIPSKSLLRNAEVAHTLVHRGEEYGFSFDNLSLDYGIAVERSRQVAKRITKGVEFLMKKNNVDVHFGAACLRSASTVEVMGSDGRLDMLAAKNIVVATGARPVSPASFHLDRERVLTYREAILQEHHPASVIIVGGGAIGVEFASIWNAYGCKVTIVEMMPRILPLEDEQISSELTSALKKGGIDVLAGSRVDEISSTTQGVSVNVSNEEGSKRLESEQVLVAVGFTPNSGGLGLGELGVACDEHGFVEVDANMQTTVSGVYAVGDVTGKLQLAHVASAQGMVAAESIAGHPTVELNYRMMPRATYCHPEVASFGYTEAEARDAGYDVKSSRYNFSANGKALGMGDYGGWIKIVGDAAHGEILGAHLIGPQVTELLPELTLAHHMELSGEEIARNVHAHPTLSEVVLEAAHGLAGNMIHA